MMVDINAYVGNWPFKQLTYNSCASLMERMDHFGVNLSVIANLSGIFYKNTQSANETLYAELNSNKKFKDRFLPFAIINPNYPGWKNDLEKCIKMGMKGIRIFPQYHDYMPYDSCCLELVKMARDRDLVISFPIRMVDSRQRSWMDIDHVAGTANNEWTLKNFMPIIKEVSDAKFFILNMAHGLDINAEETGLIEKGNILLDTSGRAISNMADWLKRLSPNKFAFGTHSPILDYLTGLLRIESLRNEEADESTKMLLRSGNARKMLNLA